jgi:hypothetical protein
LQLACITQLIAQPTHFNTYDGSSMFLHNVSMHLQDHNLNWKPQNF